MFNVEISPFRLKFPFISLLLNDTKSCQLIFEEFFPWFSLAFPLNVPSGLLSAEETDIREILRELLQQADIFLISTNTMAKSRKLVLFV